MSPYVLPAAPVMRLIRRRQFEWGYTDQEMANFLGLSGATYRDGRGFISRPQAERILRRLCGPAPATAGTRETYHRMRLAETSQHLAHLDPTTIAAELRGQGPAAGEGAGDEP